MKYLKPALFFGIAIFITSCEAPSSKEEETPVVLPPLILRYSVPSIGIGKAQKINFVSGQNKANITITDLENNTIYIAQISKDDSAVPYINPFDSVKTPGVTPVASYNSYGDEPEADKGGKLRDVHTLLEIEKNLPPITGEQLVEISSFRSPGTVSVNRYLSSRVENDREGAQEKFWVIKKDGFAEKNFTLRSRGSFCKIWVEDGIFDDTSSDGNDPTKDYNKDGFFDKKINQNQVEALSDIFDLQIYGLTTKLFGFEYGGGPDIGGGRNEYGQPVGGIDGDPCIHILICELYEPGFNVAGYFSPLDMRQAAQAESAGAKSNEGEIFYIDAMDLDSDPMDAYLTLVHEFQHMINFNQKTMLHGEKSSTWFNEMLSVLAEDILSDMVLYHAPASAKENGFFYCHPYHTRFRLALGGLPYSGVTQWDNRNFPALSYANNYTFGAYLIRNFGGAKLVNAMSTNEYVDETAITKALASCVGYSANSSIKTFQAALSCYAGALLNSEPKEQTEAGITFNRTVTETVNERSYTCAAFDVERTRRYMMNFKDDGAEDTISRTTSTGPLVFSTETIPAGFKLGNKYSTVFQTDPKFTKVSGTKALNITRTGNSEMYIILK